MNLYPLQIFLFLFLFPSLIQDEDLGIMRVSDVPFLFFLSLPSHFMRVSSLLDSKL